VKRRRQSEPAGYRVQFRGDKTGVGREQIRAQDPWELVAHPAHQSVLDDRLRLALIEVGMHPGQPRRFVAVVVETVQRAIEREEARSQPMEERHLPRGQPVGFETDPPLGEVVISPSAMEAFPPEPIEEPTALGFGVRPDRGTRRRVSRGQPGICVQRHGQERIATSGR